MTLDNINKAIRLRYASPVKKSVQMTPSGSSSSIPKMRVLSVAFQGSINTALKLSTLFTSCQKNVFCNVIVIYLRLLCQALFCERFLWINMVSRVFGPPALDKVRLAAPEDATFIMGLMNESMAKNFRIDHILDIIRLM